MEKSEKHHEKEEHYQKRDEGEGTLIRGANGRLYFIPDEKLEAFRVPEEKAYLAERLFFHQDSLQFVSSIKGRLVSDTLGLRAGGSTTVSILNLGSIRQLKG